MKNCLEPVDLMVGVGLLATILGAAFLFLTVNGAVSVPFPDTAAAGPETSILDPMASVQVAMGEAIVNDAVGEWRANRRMERSVLALNRALISADELRGQAQGGLMADLTAYDRLTRTQELVRGQFVMGRRIVTETGRGLRSGVYGTVPLGERYNRRVIRAAERDGARIERALDFSHDPAIGRLITEASLEQPRLLAMAEQRKGRAVVQYASAQNDAASTLGGAQQQLAALTIAVLHHEQIMDRFEALAKAQIPPSQETVAFSGPKAWNVPGEMVVSFAIVAIGILVFCIAVLKGREEEAVSEPMPLPEAKAAPYRRAV